MKQSLEKKRIRYLLLILFLPVFFDGFNSLLRDFLHMDSTSIVTLIVTVGVALYGWTLICKGFLIKSVFQYLIILMIFALNYLLFDYSREYLTDTGMLMRYVFELPISIMLVGNISDWTDFLKEAKPFCLLTALTCVVVITITNFSVNLSYMEFSYAVLPFIMITYILARTKREKSTTFSFIVMCVSILVFGARAPILFLFAFILYTEIIGFENRSKHILVLLGCGVGALIVFSIFKTQIISWAIKISAATGSYFLQKLFTGELLISRGREEINALTNHALAEMGFYIYGLFGDRYVTGVIYAHNIAKEIFLSFGWIIGSFIIAYGILKVVAFFLSKPSGEERILIGLVLLGLFARYLLSGSFVIEGRFYICIGMLTAIMRNKRTRCHVVMHRRVYNGNKLRH